MPPRHWLFNVWETCLYSQEVLLATINMGKKKKSKGRTATDNEEAKDEMLALQSIFLEDFRPHASGLGFSLVAVPHPGDAAVNFVSVELDIRYSPGYPSQELDLRVQNQKGLAQSQSRSLSKLLHQVVRQHAQSGEVCVFNVVDACQEFLRIHNVIPEADDPKPSSLWHEMQRRDKRDQDMPEAGQSDDLCAVDSLTVLEQGWGDFGFGALFHEDDDAAWSLPVMPLQQRAFQREATTGVASQFMERLNLDEFELDPKQHAEQGDRILGGSSDEGKEARASSNSMMGSMLTRMRSAVRGMLGLWPPAIRQLLEGPAQSGADSTDALTHQENLSAEQLALRKDVLMGHLLRLAVRGDQADAPALPAHALPSLASELAAEGLVPKWVQWALVQQPALFDRAYSRLFAKELSQTTRGPSSGDQADAWALRRFWQPQPTAAGRRAPERSSSEPLSRYLSDFQEIRVLGRGAYGLAVAAVNRLDGRQYAVKKIRLQPQVPSEFSRIMREVATLSRLQHTNIVRYFQAWTEAAGTQEATGTEGESELQDWLGSGSASNTAPPPAAVRANADLKSPQIAGLSLGTEVGVSSNAEAGDSSDDTGNGLWHRRSKTTTSKGSAGSIDSKSSSSDTESGAAESETESRQDGMGKLQMLYIQMEFCPRTLKQVLAQGPIDDADAWQILRQILAGLAHIHSQGIIHRDLKPENIFFDSQAVLKLGDFGLAKFSRAANEPAQLADPDTDDDEGGGTHGPISTSSAFAQHSRMQSEVTGRVGTSFYMSPEVANGWARYDSKVDLYSLGVVAFELWHPFSTGMERVMLLQALRDRGTLPTEWQAQHQQVANLIRWLLAPNPAERPTAREVLRSNMLPATVGDEQLSDLLRSLPENADTLDRVVDTIFSLPTNRHGQVDPNEVPGNPTTGQISIREELTRIMKGVFDWHGAVPMSSSVIGFNTTDAPLNAAVLLDRSSAVLALKHEMRAPFAAWLARQAGLAAEAGRGLEAMRRYEIAWVRRKAPGRALPRAFLQADLDLLASSNKSTVEAALLEAEAAKIVVEVLDALPETPTYEVRLGHRVLLEALLEYIGLSQEVAKSAMELLATTAAITPRHPKERTKHWPSVRIALDGLRVHPDAISRCKQFVLQIPGEAEASLLRLRKKLESPGFGGKRVSPAALAAIDSLAAVVTHLHEWDLKPAQVVVDPLLWPHADYLTGALVQVHVLSADAGGASSLVAAGGRYDGLLRKLWPPQAAAIAPPLAAVGLTLNVKLLLPFMDAPLLQSATPISQADVLVCSRGGGGMLKERMALAKELWSAGVRAQFLHSAAPSMTAQFEFASAHKISWLAIIQSSAFSAADTVKVRNLDRRTEEDMPFGEVARYLSGALHTASRSTFGRSNSSSYPLLRHIPEETDPTTDDMRGQDDEPLKILNQKPRRPRERQRN